MLVTARDEARFPERRRDALAEVLRALRVNASSLEQELAAMKDYWLAKTKNPRALGTMNDDVRMLEVGEPTAPSLISAALDLARAPCSPIGMRSRL